MKPQAQALTEVPPHSVHSGRCLYKILSLTVHRNVHEIEAGSEAEALELAQHSNPEIGCGQVIGRTDVVTVVRPHGGSCHV